MCNDVGEADESLSDEQKEEVTKPSEEVSDEGDSEDPEDEIANKDSEEADSSEGDVKDNEKPEDKADSENDDSEGITLMGVEDIAPYAADIAYGVTFKNTQNHTITDNADTTTAGEAYTFKVQLASGYKDLVVTAYTGETLESNNSNKLDVTTAGPASDVYTCTISNDALVAIPDGITGITIEITATEIPKYTLTITKADTGINKVEYATIPEDEGEKKADWKEAGASIDSIEEGTEVYVRVTAAENYTYTVKSQYADEEATEAAKVEGKDYYKFTMSKNLTLDITASEVKTAYEVVVSTDAYAELTWEPADLVTTTDGKSTVPANTDLTFKVSVKEAAADTHKIDTVKYKIGEGTDKEITANDDGIYTIGKDEITGKVTITVTTAEYQNYAITFNYGDQLDAPTITAGGEALAAGKWDGDTKKATVSEKDEISFKLNLKTDSKYEIDKVTYGATDADADTYTELTPAEDGTYTLGKVTKHTTVKVTVKVDEDKANRLTLAAEGSSRGYSVAFIQDGDNALDDGIDDTATYRSGDKIVTLTPSFYALITPSKGFELKGVAGSADGVTYTKQTALPEGVTLPEGITLDSAELYKITYTKAAALELKVNAAAVASTAEQTVLFANKSGRLTYAVDLGEKITKKLNTVNTYVVAAGATAFDFTVNAAIGYVPSVSYEDEKGDDVSVQYEGTEGTLSKDKKTKAYTYKLAVGELPNNTVITLDAEVDKQTVSLVYNDDEVDITAIRIGAKQYDDTYDQTDLENGLTQVDLKVPHGETVTISAEAYDRCKITNVMTQLGTDAAKKASFKPAGFEVSLKADVTTNKNWSLNITSEKLYAGRLEDTTAGGTKIEPVKNVYTVDYDHTYTVKALHGYTSVGTVLSKAEVLAKSGNKEIEGVTVTLGENNKSASFTLNEKAADAKNLVVNLYVEGQDKPVVTFALTVRPVITKVTVTGVKNGAVEQTVDTTKEYAVKVDPKTANSGVLLAVVDPAVAGVSASLNGTKDKLSITTSQTLDQTATVKFYTVPYGMDADVASNRTPIAADKGGEFTVKSVAQLTDKVKPTMKLASSDDTKLTLTLGAPKTLADAAAGTMLYEVKIASKGAAKDTKDAAAAEANVKTALGAAGTKTYYVPKTRGVLSQDATFTVNGAARGAGDAWEYNVDVTLVQAKEAIKNTVVDGEAGVTVTPIGSKSSSVSTGNKPYATKAPYYEDKLTLKKGTTTIYTGQQYSADKKGNVDYDGVLIATAQFGKNTTYTKVTWAKDDHEWNGPLTLTVVDGNKIYAKADKSGYSANSDDGDSYTALGKHKITVYAESDTGMHSATATVDVTVVEGIERLKVNVPTTSLYKVDKKAASLKATVDYNPGAGKTYAAKTKKVEWSILDQAGNNVNEDPYHPMYKKVTVKNGSVSVDKNYVVSSDEEKNQFYVYVKATDYYDNYTEAWSDVITITNQAQDIGELVLAKWDSDSYGYKVLARNGATVTAAQLEDAQLYVLRRGTPEKTFQWDDMLNAKCFTFTSSNKAVVLEERSDEYDRYIGVSVAKPAKNVKLTATANDGSKQKVVMTLTVDYDTVNEGELGLHIETSDPSYYKENDPGNEATALTFDGTTANKYFVYVVKKVDGEWKYISDYTDFKVTAKNAKAITTGGTYNQNMDFVNTKKDAEITLTYSVPKASGKGFDKKTRTYKVTNTGYDAAKAPKVTLSGSLTAVYTDKAQVISGTVTPDKSVSGYPFKGKQVRVEPDWTAVNAKNENDYYDLYEQLNDCYVDENGKLTLKFAKEEYDEYDGQNVTVTRIPAGTYKLKVTLGTWNYDSDTVGGEFVPDSQATTVTLKAVARKVVKGSFKPTTTYTLSMLDSSVTLTGKGKDIRSYGFSNLQNDNVKGAKNNFTKYFTLETDYETNISVLKLNSEELSQSQYSGKKLSEIIPAADRTAYVTYWATLGTDLWGSQNSWVEDTVKITVKLTDKTDGKNDSVKKYAASNATVLGDKAVVTANIAVTADGKPADIALAYAKDTTEAPGFTVYNYDEGNVVLQSKAKPAVGKHTIDLYVVPADSYWVSVISQIVIKDSSNDIDADKTEEAQNQAIMANGVKLTVTVDVKDPATTKDKIKVGNTNVVFTNENYSDDGFGNYWVNIPYTKVMDCEIDEIQVDTNSPLSGLINFRSEFNEEEYRAFISASISKKALSDAVSATGSKLSWGQKNITVKTTVTFKSGSKDGGDYGDAKQAEDITFKVTLPKEAASKTFAQIVEDVKAHQDDIMKVELPEDWSALDDIDSDEKGFTELDYAVDGIKWQVYDNLKEYVPGDSDVKIEFDEDMNNAYSVGYSPAATDEAGSLIIKMTLVDLTTGEEIKDGQGNVTGYDFTEATKVELESEKDAGGYKFVIPKLSLSATDSAVSEKINELMDGISDSDEITISNATTAGDIRNYLKEGAEDVLGTNLVLWVEILDNSTYKATDAAAGNIAVRVTVRSKNGGEPFEAVYSSIVIPQLTPISSLVTKIDTALAKLPVSNTTTQEDITAAIEKVIADNNPDVELAWAKKADSEEDDFTIKKAEIPAGDKDGKGSITGKIVLTNTKSASSENDDKELEHPISIEIPALMTSDDAITAVKNAAISEANAKEFAKSNVEATVKKAVLDAANEAVENEPYVVSFKLDGETELFAFKPVKWNENGEISYTLEVKVKNEDGTTGAAVDDKGALAQGKVTLDKDINLQTKADVAAAAKEAGEEISVETADFADETATTTKQTAIENAVKAALANKFTVTVTTGLAITTEPAVGTEGKASITFSVKEGENDESPVTVTCEYTLPALEGGSGD